MPFYKETFYIQSNEKEALATPTLAGPWHSFTPLCANFLDSCLCLWSKLTIFGGETRFSYFRGCNFGPSVGDVDTTPVNSVPWSRCFDESKGFRFFVLIFSQMMTCFISDSGENFREQTGQRSSRMFGGGISIKISLSCWCSSGCWCCSGWYSREYSCPPSKSARERKSLEIN